MKKTHTIIGILSLLMVGALVILSGNTSFAANTNTPTTMKIKTGVLIFYKDTGTNMNTYFGHSPNTSDEINLGEYDASLSAINAASSGDHRFTVSDLAGKSFTVTVQSSSLTASGVTAIPAANVGYTGTARTGAGKALTIAPTSASDIGTLPVNFVGRANNSGVSKFSQEITLTVAIPAAQAPESYTGLLTFTY